MKKSLSAIAVIAVLAVLALSARATQIDTNATTSITTRVPARVGELLIGKTGGTTTV